MPRTLAPLVAVLLALVACADATPTPRAGDPAPSADTAVPARVDAYETVIRDLIGSDRWETIYLQEGICANAGEPSQPMGCDDALTQDEQADLRTRLADLGAPVRFVASYEEADPDQRILDGREHSVFVKLGPVANGPEGSLEVPAGMACGGLCGTGGTWKLVQRDGGWRVDGTAGGSVWIA